MTGIHISIFISLFERYSLIAVSLASSILIARLLKPEEIGIYSVSLAIIGIAQVIRDFGIGNFLIQEKNISESHISTAFGISLLIGGSLFVILYISAPFIASFYGESLIIETMRISSVNFLILPFGYISFSLLRREMAFKKTMKVNVVASIMSFVVTVSLAYSGFGANSLAVGSVTQNLMMGFGSWFARVERKFLLPNFSEWRAILKFGGQSFLINLANTIATDITDIALGKIVGLAQVAYISKAQGIMNIYYRDISAAIVNVIFPAFSKACREDLDLERIHIFAIGSVSVIAWPFYGFCATYSLDIVRLLYGTQWDIVASLLPWFCLAGFADTPSSLIWTVLMARGRIDLMTKWSFIVQPLKTIILLAAVTLTKSINYFAIFFALVFILNSIFAWYIKSKCQKTNYRYLSTTLVKSLLVTLVCMIPALFVISVKSNIAGFDFYFFMLAGWLCLSSWGAALILLSHPLVTDTLISNFVDRFQLKMLSLLGLLIGLLFLFIVDYYQYFHEIIQESIKPLLSRLLILSPPQAALIR